MALHQENYPALAVEVASQLQNWPGDPSLAIIGTQGVLGLRETGRVYRLASVTKILTALTIPPWTRASSRSMTRPVRPGPRFCTCCPMRQVWALTMRRCGPRLEPGEFTRTPE